ncbi:hypothetical protein Dda_8672 [Drechslerella dactyloides]|uniref:PIN domain-containing protein n=1 Tax=Drechslerella dactyloides TaxID=74499 RepID=A0AAD6IRX0_DREDA|nr:hypothetical protein Dda_8672 [Drechslerella dactyloides]
MGLAVSQAVAGRLGEGVDVDAAERVRRAGPIFLFGLQPSSSTPSPPPSRNLRHRPRPPELHVVRLSKLTARKPRAQALLSPAPLDDGHTDCCQYATLDSAAAVTIAAKAAAAAATTSASSRCSKSRKATRPVARLKHTVSELEDQVEFDRRNNPIPPPKPTTLHLVPDASALTTSITEIKAYVAEDSAKVTVPLCVLDSLDALKRGSESENINARETVRWFDRTVGKGTSEKGVKVQAPGEVYGRWEECLEWYNPLTMAPDDGDEIAFTSPLAMTESQMLAQATDSTNQLSISPSPPSSPAVGTSAPLPMPPRILKHGNTFHHPAAGVPKQQVTLPRSASTPLQEPTSPTSSLHAPDVPRKVQPIINCALEILHSEKTEFSKKSEGVFFLITNNPEISHWAKSFGIPALNTKELAGKIAEEKRLYKAKKRDWDHMHSSKANQPVLDANDFRNRDLRMSPKTAPSQPHLQSGRGGGRSNASPSGVFNDDHQPRRRNRHNQNARPSTANETSNGKSVRGGRGGYHARIHSHAHQEKHQNDAVHGTSPTQHHGHNTPSKQTFERAQLDGEPEYVLGRGANRGVARGKGKLWVP